MHLDDVACPESDVALCNKISTIEQVSTVRQIKGRIDGFVIGPSLQRGMNVMFRTGYTFIAHAMRIDSLLVDSSLCCDMYLQSCAAYIVIKETKRRERTRLIDGLCIVPGLQRGLNVIFFAGCGVPTLARRIDGLHIASNPRPTSQIRLN